MPSKTDDPNCIEWLRTWTWASFQRMNSPSRQIHSVAGSLAMELLRLRRVATGRNMTGVVSRQTVASSVSSLAASTDVESYLVLITELNTRDRQLSAGSRLDRNL